MPGPVWRWCLRLVGLLLLDGLLVVLLDWRSQSWPGCCSLPSSPSLSAAATRPEERAWVCLVVRACSRPWTCCQPSSSTLSAAWASPHDLQLYHSVNVWEITIFNYQWYIRSMERLMVNVRHILPHLTTIFQIVVLVRIFFPLTSAKIVGLSCLRQSRRTTYFICIVLMIWIWIKRKCLLYNSTN